MLMFESKEDSKRPRFSIDLHCKIKVRGKM